MATIQDVIEQAEKLCNAHEKELREKPVPVEFKGMKNHTLKHSLYWQTIDLANEISVHYVWGSDPEELIHKARPYEPENIKDYRRDAYEQETFPHGQRILGLVKGALSHPQLFSINFPPPPIGADDKGEKIEDYVYTGMPIPNVSNLNTFFWEFLFQMSMVDPNGWVAVLQKTPDFQLVENPDQFRDPYPEFIPSANVLDYGEDYCLVVTTEEIEYKEKSFAPSFYYFTPDATIKCFPIGENKPKGGVQYKAVVWHEHNYGELQIRQVGGIISGVKNSVLESNPQSFHLSHLQGTIPALNKAVRYYSDLDAMFVLHMHPIKVEELTACETCQGIGKVQGGEICPSCNGSKTSTGSGVMAGYSKAPSQTTGKIESPVLYVSPDPKIFSEAKEFVREKLAEGYEGVNAGFLIRKSGGQNEAARSRELNREPLMLYFRQVAGTIFPLYQWILDLMNRIRYEAVLGIRYLENRPVIIEPANYDTSILDSIITELESIEKTNMPAAIVNRIYQNAITKRFGAENKSAKVMITYSQVDIFSGMSPDEILVMSTHQNIDPIRLYIHDNVVTLVDECLIDDSNFLELGEIEKRTIVYEKAKELAPQQTPIISQQSEPLDNE